MSNCVTDARMGLLLPGSMSSGRVLPTTGYSTATSASPVGHVSKQARAGRSTLAYSLEALYLKGGSTSLMKSSSWKPRSGKAKASEMLWTYLGEPSRMVQGGPRMSPNLSHKWRLGLLPSASSRDQVLTSASRTLAVLGDKFLGSKRCPGLSYGVGSRPSSGLTPIGPSILG